MSCVTHSHVCHDCGIADDALSLLNRCDLPRFLLTPTMTMAPVTAVKDWREGAG